MKELNIPKISIVMGIYNCEKYISESIESIINQTYDNWELIMCDDGSKDDTYKIAESYKKKYNKKIILLKNDTNMGLNYTLNKCIKESTGQYIARQDGDDISLPQRLETEIKFLQNNPKYSLVSTNMIFFDESGDWGTSRNFGEVKKENFIKGSPICHAPCMIKKEVLLSVDCYSVSKKLLRIEDYHLWFKLFINNYKCYNLKEALYKMRDDSDAYKRRNLKNRINETRLKLWGFKKIGISITKYIWAFKPIIAYILPEKIYKIYHRKNLNFISKNRKIKIAQFVGSMNCGGTETMLMNLFRSIDKNKYEFVFIEDVKEKCWYDDEIIQLGGKIIKISSIKEVGYFKYIKLLKTLFQKEKFDVVHSHTFLHSGLVLLAAKKANIKIRIAHSHSAIRKTEESASLKIKLLLLKPMILKNANLLLACSTDAGLFLFGKKFYKKGQLFLNPIRMDYIEQIIDNKKIKENLLKKYSIDNDTIVLGHVGRMVELKNHDFMLKIAEKLKKDNKKFKLFFIGDGDEKSNISKRIKELNLEKNIVMTGNLSNALDYYLIFDIFILPSKYEGLPLTVIEAQTCNNYCLVSNRVSHECDIGNVKFLSIDEGIDLWVKEILKYGKKKRNHSINDIVINSGFNISKSVKELEDIYEKNITMVKE